MLEEAKLTAEAVSIDNQEDEPTMVKDEALMQAYANGDASAFDRLYARHKVAVYRFFLRQNLTEAVAEELTHDTWLRVIKASDRYTESAQFRTYLFSIARNISVDYYRKKSTQHENTAYTDDNEPYSQEADSHAADSLDGQQLNAAIKQQIALLPDIQREIFLLKQESGFTIEEIAEITRQNKEKVKSSWRYAVKKLRVGLQHYV